GGRGGRDAGERAAKVFELMAALPTVREEGPVGWGYPFPWQSRHLGLASAHMPNAVCSAFAGEALLDLAESRAPEGQPPFPRPRLLRLNLPGSKQLSARAWRLACQTAVYVLRMHPSVRTERGL